jgi:MoxR-like ATPase
MTTLNVPAVGHKELEQIYSIALRTKKSVIVVGKYGIGKTASAYSFAAKNNMKVIDLKLSQFDAVTLRGIPSVKDGLTVWNVPKTISELSSGNAILLLDEFDKATPSVAAASYELLLQRKYGDFVLPDSVLIICTANFESEDFRSEKLSIPQLDRVLRFELVLNTSEWLEWAEKKPIDSRIINFIKENPNLLWRAGDEERMCTTSPRGWEAASDTIIDIPSEEIESLKMLVGSAVGNDIGELFADSISSKAQIYEKAFRDKEYDAIAKLEVGEKRQFTAILAEKAEQKPKEVFQWLSEYLAQTNDGEYVVFALRDIKDKMTEPKFNRAMRTTIWQGKEEFLKKLKELAVGA